MRESEMTTLNDATKLSFVAELTTRYGNTVTNKQVEDLRNEYGISPPYWFFREFAQKESRGKYIIVNAENAGNNYAPPASDVAVWEDDGGAPVSEVAMAPADIIPLTRRSTPAAIRFDPNVVSEYEYAIVPDRDRSYVPFGDFKDVESIIKSCQFFPVFISGLSGNGKTFMVEQACSRAKRPMVRVQMSRETDEDDLIGGFRLIDGETRFMKGPVLRAMELGAVLLIDEADRADPGKVMCLQGVLEGKPYYVKKTGEVVKPEMGFNIIVTANTKGKGSDDGRYVAATILDDAWLERFPITIEQHFPSDAVEKKILRSHGLDDDFITHLVAWSAVIRKTFMEGAIDELISTRRLVHIAKTYALFSNRMRAIELCINRFDEETKTAFLELYAKVDPTVVPETPVEIDAELDALADSLALDSSDSASS
jgi:cobaltochelatase CobS